MSIKLHKEFSMPFLRIRREWNLVTCVKIRFSLLQETVKMYNIFNVILSNPNEVDLGYLYPLENRMIKFKILDLFIS